MIGAIGEVSFFIYPERSEDDLNIKHVKIMDNSDDKIALFRIARNV